MANIPKLIRTLKTRASLQEFTHYIPLNPSQLLYDIWLCIQELVYSENSFEIMQEIFIKTLYFFHKDLTLGLEKKYSKLIKEFSNVLMSGNAQEIKLKLYSAELKDLLLDIQSFIEHSEESWVQHFESLFKFIGISIVEISESSKSPAWQCSDQLIQINLFERPDEIFFLISKEKLNLPKPSISELEPDSPLLCTPYSEPDQRDKSDQLAALNETNDSIVENCESEEDADWEASQSVLNNTKPQLIPTMPKSPNPPLQLTDLPLSPRDLPKYSSAVQLDPSKIISSLALSLVQIFNKHNLFHISLQIITNTLYYFPFSHTRAFEQKHLKLTQDIIQAFSSENTEKIHDLVSSPEFSKVFEEIEGNLEKNENSLLMPVFPLIKTWKILFIERNLSQEYIWNVNKPLARFVLYLHKDQVYLLEPAGKLNLKEFRVEDGDLKADGGGRGNDEVLGLEANEDVLECKGIDEDLLESERDGDDLLVSASSEPKIVKFKPELAVDIERVREDANMSPSPTLKSALKRNSIVSPDPRFESPVAKYVESAKKFKSPVDRYVALAKNGKK